MAAAPAAVSPDTGPLHHHHLLPAAHANHYVPCKFADPGVEATPQMTFLSPDGAYKINDTIRINWQSTFHPVSVSDLGHTRLALETGDVDRFAVYSSHTSPGTTGDGYTIIDSIQYAYTVQPGDYSDDLDYVSRNALYWRNPNGNNLHDQDLGFETQCRLADPGTSYAGSIHNSNRPSLSVNARVVADGILPRLLGVGMADGAYGAGSVLEVAVNFDEPVFVYGPEPSLKLALDGGNATAAYDASSNGTASAVFNYTVQPGDVSDGLGYAGAGALAPAGSITDEAGNAAALALPEPGAPGSLAASSSVYVTAAPGRVLNVTTPLSGGTYPTGYRIPISVDFDETVVYSGAPPSLELAVGDATRTALYESGNDTRSLVFAYEVQQGDAGAVSLDYSSTGALSAAGGLRDRAGDAVNSTLPAPGGPGSIRNSASISIDGSGAVHVTGVSTRAADGAHRQGAAIDITVGFSAPVAVAGLPALALATDPPRSAEYASGSGSDKIVFRYEVQPGDTAARLDYAGTAALALGGGAAVGSASGSGAAALLALPAPGTPGSLGHSKNIAIDTAAPSVVRAGTPGPDGIYRTGRVIDIAAAFDEPVVVRGATWIELAAGGPPLRAEYVSGNNTAELAFAYTVRPSDDVAGGPGRGGGDGISLGGGAAIGDAAGNAANLTLPDLGLEGIRMLGGIAPLLFPADHATDDADGFSWLGGAIDAAAIPPGGGNGGGASGALVAIASAADHAVQLVRVHENGTIAPVSEIVNNNERELNEPHGIDAFRLLDNSAYAIVSSIIDDGVQLVRVHDNGTLEAKNRLPHSTGLNLDGIIGIDAFRLRDNSTYAIVASTFPTDLASRGVQLVRVHENGTLRAADALDDDSDLVLNGASAVSAFRMANGSTLVAVGASADDDGVQLVRVHENGTLAAADSIGDNGTLLLDGIRGIDTIKTPGGSTFAVAASVGNSGVQLVRVHDNGTLEAEGSLGNSDTLELNQAWDVDAFHLGRSAYALAVADADSGAQLMRIHEDGTLRAAGTARDGVGGFEELYQPEGVKVFETAEGRTFGMVAARGDDGVQLVRISPAFVTGVTADAPDREYPAGYPIEIRVNFSEPVAVSGPPPYLLLGPANGTARAAEYVSGDGTNSLVFRYVAQQGDGSGLLGYAGPAALATRGGVFDLAADPAADANPADLLALRASGPNNALLPYDRFLSSPPADLELPAPGGPGSLGHASGVEILAPPSIVTGVSSPNASGTYGANSTIDIVVRLSARVAVTGSPVLELATEPPRNATYVPGAAATDKLVFRYVVQAGDKAADLDYAGVGALALDGGGGASVRDLSRDADAVLFLPEPGKPGSLGHTKDIGIDAAAPAVLRVFSPNLNGTYGTGRIVNITVAFDEPVVVVAAGSGIGAPVLELATAPPRNATYDSGSGTAELSFLYAVQPGDKAKDLGYTGTGALRLNGAAIRDGIGNEAGESGRLSLPAPGSPDSLAASKDIGIRGAKLPVLAVAGHNATAGTLAFAGAHRPAVFEAGDSTYAVVTSHGENAAMLARVHGNGTLEELDRLTKAGDSSPLGGAIGIDAFEQGNRTYALVASSGDDAVVLLEVHLGNGTLNEIADIRDGGGLNLLNAIGVDAFKMNDRIYAFVASNGDHAVVLLEVHPGNGTFKVVDEIKGANNDDLRLNGAADIAVFNLDNRRYAIAAARDEGGVQLVRIRGNGTLEADPAHQLADNDTLALSSPLAIDVFNASGRTYALAASDHNDWGVQLVRIHGNGTLEAAGTLADTGALRLGQPSGVDAFEMGSAAYAIVAARTDDGVQLVRVRDDGALEAAGSVANGAVFPRLDGAYGVAVFSMANHTYAMVASADGGGGGSGVQLIRLSPVSVASVESTLVPGAAYAAGHRFNVTVAFDGPVLLTGPPPSLLLDIAGPAVRAAGYLSGSGTSSLVFGYTVQPGDSSSRLDYAGSGALVTRGTVEDSRASGAGASGATAADLELPSIDSLRSLGALGVKIDTLPPSVQAVSFLNKSGAYGPGSSMRIAVEFDEAVFVAGTPRLALNTMPPANATYSAGNGTAMLEFMYTVRNGDNADGPLGYAGRTALSAAAGEGGAGAAAIRDEAGNDANLALPDPDSIEPSGIRIDTRAPSVQAVSFLNKSGAYGPGSSMRIAVEFDEAVFVAGTPRLALDTMPPANATYSAGNGSDTLEFLYVVRDGDAADPLGYAGRTALSAAAAAAGSGGEDGAASIRDNAGNDANLALPEPAAPEMRDPSITIDGRAPTIKSAEAASLSTIRVTFDELVESEGNAGAGWSISGPDAGSLAVESGSDISQPSTVLTLTLGGGVLPDTAPDISLSYEAGAEGGIADAAGNALPDSGSLAVADRIQPRVNSSLIVDDNRIRIGYTEPTVALSGAYRSLVLDDTTRTIADVLGNRSASHVLEFSPAAGLGANGSVTIDRAAVRDRAVPPNLLGAAAGDLVLEIYDERVLAVTSSKIVGPGTAAVEYTRAAPAQPGHYGSLVVDGQPRSITGLGGGGTRLHELAFSPGGAPPDATGSVAVDIPGLHGGSRTFSLADGQSPAVLNATAVSGAEIRVMLSEPVVTAAGGAAGWSISGGDAEGLNVSAALAALPAPALPAVLSLALDGNLSGGTAPSGMTLRYDPARGNVSDPAGNLLGASDPRVGDGIAPELESAAIAGPNRADVEYSEAVHAPLDAYKSVSLSTGGGPRPVTALAGNESRAHEISFGGGAALPGTEGTIGIDETAVLDAAGNRLGQDADLSVRLADGQAPALPPAREGHASVKRAVFTARNEATITYSDALGKPEGRAGYAYESVLVAGEGGAARPVTGETGLGTAMHTVLFGGNGVAGDRNGTVLLAVELVSPAAASAAAGGDGGPPLRFAADEGIPVAPGRVLHTAILSQEQPGRAVEIRADGFTRAVDATAAGPGARPAVNVTALAASGAAGPGNAPGFVTFPAEPVSLAAAFASVEFPPGATARPVPPGGLLFLRALAADQYPPIAAAVASALVRPNASGLELRGIVEAASADGGGPVVFDRPVRIFLADQQHGGSAFYVNGSASSPLAAALIDVACASDDAAAVHGQLGGAGECQLDVPGGGAGASGGKAIYTYHLTVFGTVRTGGAVDPVDPVDPADRPKPASVHVLQRAGGDPVRAPVSYSAGQTVVIAVRFTAPVAVDAGAGGAGGAVPYLELRTGSAGARAAYSSGSGTDALEFEYAVRGGDIAARLSYAGADALALNGSGIVAAGTGEAASVVLPEPGAPGSLSDPGGPAVRIDPEPGRPVLQVGILDDAGRGGGASMAAAAAAAAAAFNERQGLAAAALIVNATVYDAGTAPESAAGALRAAHAGGSGPSVYVGPSTDRGLHAAMPYAAANNIVLVSAGSTAPSLAVEDDLVFRLLPSARLDAEALARHALNAGSESLHAVLENATHGPPTAAGQALEDATPPPPGRFSHAFDAALAYAGVPSLSGTVSLAGAAGSYGAAAAAEALDASVRSASARAAVVYMGSPEGLAALAAASGQYPALASAVWLATGPSAGSVLLAGDGPAAAFAAQAGLSAARWSPSTGTQAREIDPLLPPDSDAGARHRAYAAYDAVLVIGEAAAGARGGDGTTFAAEIAGRIPAAAAAYSGALGDIALDHAGDLWAPAKYGLWTVAQAGAGDAGGSEWSRQQDALDEERACSIALARAKIDYGPIDSGQTSRPHLQTIVNTGQLPFSRVDLTATPWHVDSPGGCAPGDSPSLPVGLSEIRTELGGLFSDLAGSGTVLARGLEAGGQAPLWYRLSLAGYADLPQAQITQCATYVVRCG